jgi:hypothetical protein
LQSEAIAVSGRWVMASTGLRIILYHRTFRRFFHHIPAKISTPRHSSRGKGCIGDGLFVMTVRRRRSAGAMVELRREAETRMAAMRPRSVSGVAAVVAVWLAAGALFGWLLSA